MACLAACHKSHSADANLVVSDALDVLHKTGHCLSLQELPPELPSALLRQLCQALDPHCSPLQIRITAAGDFCCAPAANLFVKLQFAGKLFARKCTAGDMALAQICITMADPPADVMDTVNSCNN